MDAAEKTANRELQQALRRAYMNHELSHDDHYLQLSDWLGLTDDLIPFTNEAVQASQDPHLNDLPLHNWDQMDFLVRDYATRKGLPWSLSDTVCCLKAMARRRAGKTSL